MAGVEKSCHRTYDDSFHGRYGYLSPGAFFVCVGVYYLHMYQAINDFVIATKEDSQSETSSGIIVSSGEPRYKVVATTEVTKELEDKVVLGRANALDHGFYYIDYKEIVAVVV